MACAELFMMALVAALRKSNMTHEPIVMWLGNSSSPPRLIPWSSVNKSPGGPPKSSVAGSPEKLAKPLRHSGEQAMTSLASRISTPAVSLRSQSAHPHGKKNGMSVKKRKGSDAHGARKKKKKGGKKKPKKGLKKQRGVKGHSKQKGRKKAKGSKKPPNKMKKQTTRKLPTKHSTRSPKLPGSSNGSHLRETTRGHQRHHSSPEGGQRSQSKTPTTKPGGTERHKKGTDGDKNSPTGTSTKPEGATVSGTRKPERNPTGASDLPGKATQKPRDGKKHSTGRDTHGTGHLHHRRHHGTTKANGLVHSVTKPEHGGRHKKHQTPHHGGPTATSHHGKPHKTSATNSAENTGRKRGTGQAAQASSQAPSKKSPVVTQSPNAESSKSVGSTSQESTAKRSKPAKPPGSSSAMKPAGSTKTSATKNVFSSTTVGGTVSGGAKGDSKSSDTSGKVTTAPSKTMSSDVTSLLTALRRLEEASKGRDKTTENGSASTKRPEAKAGEEASMSPVPALVTGNVSLSSVLRTIPVKSPEASTKKSRR